VTRPGIGPRPSDDPHPIDALGTDEDTWAAWGKLDAFPDVGLADVASAVIVAAHPDDEVLGAGGLISILAASGARLRLVAVTDGEGSHSASLASRPRPASPGRADPATLGRRRATESARALRVLGAGTAEVIRLGMPDTGLAEHEEKLTAMLAPLVAGFDVCLAPWEHDMHPDHETAGRAARRADGSPVLCYPVWMWHWASPADPRVPWDRAVCVPLTPDAAARKRAAISSFTSQTEDRGDGLGPVLSPAMIAHFTRTMEVLLR
jgi:LmbE family N-acetylglucosaminyl deacetylase